MILLQANLTILLKQRNALQLIVGTARMVCKSDGAIRNWLNKGAAENEIIKAEICTNSEIQGAYLLILNTILI